MTAERRTTNDERRLLRIGEVAKLTGTTARTIRYYEEIGLLPAVAGREPGSHRLFGHDDVVRLEELLELKSVLGISLEELREVAAAETARSALRREWHDGTADPVRRREILDQAAAYVGTQLELVRRRRDAIAELEAELVAKRRRLSVLRRELENELEPDGAAV